MIGKIIYNNINNSVQWLVEIIMPARLNAPPDRWLDGDLMKGGWVRSSELPRRREGAWPARSGFMRGGLV